MKIIRDTPLMSCNDINILKMIDNNTISICCPVCGEIMKLEESYISLK